MRVIVIAAAAVLAAIAAWFFLARDGGGSPATDPAAIMRLAEAKPSGDLAAQDDYEAFFASLPEALTVTVEAYEREDGGAVARGVSVTATNENGQPIGVRADAFRAYDLDPQAGEILSSSADEGRRLAGRIDLRGMTMVGLDDMAQAVSERALAAADGAVGASGIEQSFDRYEVGAARFVADEFMLFGSDLAIAEDDERAPLRRYAELMRAYAFERAIITDMAVDLAFSQEVQVPGTGVGDAAAGDDAAEPAAAPAEPVTERSEGSGRFIIARSGIGAYDRGDFAMSFAEGMEGQFETLDPTLGATMAYTFTVERQTHDGVRLADAYGYLAREAFPPSDRTDLMSLGTLKLENMQIAMMGEPFQTIAGYELDLSQWHGLMPERIAFSSDETLFLGAMATMMEGTFEQLAAAEGAEPDEIEAVRAQMNAVRTVIIDAGLEALVSDNDVTYTWSPADGAATLRAASVWTDLGAYRLEADAVLPAYEAFAGIDPAALKGDDDPLTVLMMERAAFARFALVLDDEGGLDRVLTALIAYAEMEENTGNMQMAMLRGQDAASLRAMLSGGLSMASSQLGAIAPEAQGMATTASTWLREGGTLTLTVAPETPLTMAQIKGLAAMPEGPSGAIAALGLAVQHDAPAE